jgi:RNA polymerase sigma-70 factor, ECF subfamily
MIRDADLPDLVAAAGKGEHWALTELFRAYQPPLLRYLKAQEPQAADDLAGEVWIAVARGLDQFTGTEAGFRGWLFTIARRRLIDHRRRTVRQRTDIVSSDLLDTADEWGLGGDPAGEVLERLGAQVAVDTLVAELTPDQAEAVLLRVVGGLSVAEAARIMQRPAGAVRVLCHRALRRLAAHYGEGAVAR